MVDLYPAAIDFAKENVASLYTDGRAKFVEADVRKFESERDDPFFQGTGRGSQGRK